MPSVLTGANLANRDLIYLGVSGDGDSASIGLGQFAHAMRRGINMVYIVENNGVYGLTKGQFSATSDKGAKSKRGVVNSDEAIDLVGMALQLGATFVARSFSGDKAQLVPLIEAALRHEGAAFIDCISPCVAFNNHEGSTKSFDYVREHNAAVNYLDVITGRAEITVDYAPGSVEMVTQHDGSKLRLRKLHTDYDMHDRIVRADLHAAAPRSRRDRYRPALCRSQPARSARTPQDVGHAAECVAGGCPGARIRGAGKDQRRAAIGRLRAAFCLSTACPCRLLWSLNHRRQKDKDDGQQQDDGASLR